MSRLNTQQRLSQGPRDFEVGRSFLVQPERIAAASTQNLSSLLSGLAQVSAQVVATNNAAKKKQDDEDFQITMNALNMRLSTYNQDPTETNASLLLQDYDSARERFEDPKLQAHLIQFGEPFKGSLVEQENERVASATTGYIITQGRKHATRLSQDPEFIDGVKDLPFDKQVSAIREQILTEMPEDMLQQLADDPALEGRVTSLVLNVQETAEGARRRSEQQRESIIRSNITADAYDRIRHGSDPSEQIERLVRAGMPRIDVEASLAGSAIDEIKTQQQFGQIDDLAEQMVYGARLISSIPAGNDRSDLASALASAQQFIGESATEILDSRAEVLRSTGLDPKQVELGVENELLSIASSLFGTPFDSMNDLASYGPDNSAQSGIKKSLMDVFKRFQTKHEKISDTIISSAESLIDPQGSTLDDVTGLLNLSRDQQAQMLSLMQNRLIPDDGMGPVDTETLFLLEAAKTDRGAYMRLIASKVNNTPYASAIANQIRRETLDGPMDEEGMRKVQQAIFGFGGQPEDISLLAGNDYGVSYALGKVMENFTKTGVFDVRLYNARLEEYRALKFTTRDGDSIDFYAALNDEQLTKFITGRGWFLSIGVADVEGSSQISNIRLTDTQKNLILQAVDLTDIKHIKAFKDTAQIATAVNEALDRVGVHLVVDTTFGQRGRVTMSRNKHIPEAVGQSTVKINEALNNPLSLIDRYMGSVISNNEYNSMWYTASDYLQSISITDERARSLINYEDLLRRRDEGTARIVVGTSLAGENSTPIFLQLETGGGDVQTFGPIANFDFGSETNQRFFASGLSSKAYKSPSRPPVQSPVNNSQGLYSNWIGGGGINPISPQFVGP